MIDKARSELILRGQNILEFWLHGKKWRWKTIVKLLEVREWLKKTLEFKIRWIFPRNNMKTENELTTKYDI